MHETGHEASSPPRPQQPQGSQPRQAAAPRTAHLGGRSGRCANHPGVASAATCHVCGRLLCIGCAIPVRGAVVGPECLGGLIEDAPPLEQIPARSSLLGDSLALFGFAFVVLLSVFPWSRFAASGYFDAWKVQWSLLAVASGTTGLTFALAVRRRPMDPRLEAAVYTFLALLVGLGSILHHRHPAPLTEPRLTSWLAVAGAAVVLMGVVAKLRAGRPAYRAG